MNAARTHMWAMTALSFGTGALDAATYLGMDHVFGANMTGNVIMIGFAVATTGPSVLGPLSALGGFVLASWVLGMGLRGLTLSKPGMPVPIVRLLWTITGGMFAVSAALAMLPRSEGLLHSITFVLGALMGMQAITARKVGVPDITTVVVTSTISLLFSEAGPLAGHASPAVTGRRAVAVLSMLLGASAGALLLRLGLGLETALLLPALVLLSVAALFNAGAAAPREAPKASLELIGPGKPEGAKIHP